MFNCATASNHYVAKYRLRYNNYRYCKKRQRILCGLEDHNFYGYAAQALKPTIINLVKLFLKSRDLRS